MIQASAFKILTCFMQADARNFSELCQQAGYPTDLGGYYIRRLVAGGYLTKSERGVYVITPKGKQQIAVSSGRTPTIQRPRLIALVVGRQGGQLILVRRTVQPYIGVAEWPTRSAVLGEPLAGTAGRVVTDVLSVSAQPELAGFFRRIDMFGEFIFDDKLFAVHTLTLPTDQNLPIAAPSGELFACSLADMPSVAHPAKSLHDILHFATAQSPYTEHVYQLTSADLQAASDAA